MRHGAKVGMVLDDLRAIGFGELPMFVGLHVALYLSTGIVLDLSYKP